MHPQTGLPAPLRTLWVSRYNAVGRGLKKMRRRMQVRLFGPVQQPRSPPAMQREANQDEASRAVTMRIALNVPWR